MEIQTQLPETTKEIQIQLPETTNNIQTQLPETTKEIQTQLPETTEEIQTRLPETTNDIQTQLPETTEEIQTQLPETTKEIQTQLPETTEEIQTQLPETTNIIQTQLPETTMKTIENETKESKKRKQGQKMQKLGFDIKKIVRKFKISEADVYTLDTNLDEQQRSSVQSICKNYGLISKMKGVDRHISIYKRGIMKKEENLVYFKFSDEPEEVKNKKNLAASRFADKLKMKAINQKNLVSFRFSDKSKEVLKDLFSRYPPDEYESTKNNVVEGSGVNVAVQRFMDLMFHKPSLSTSQIAKKKELLASKIKESQKLRQITELRSKLPIASFMDVILSTTLSHQVVLICGETGCGKTTQVPQFFLDDAWSKGETCKIVCTQPRRISAMSVAERIASERGESIGDTVGYKIRLESKGGRNSSLVFCTSGVLLNVLINGRSNKTMNKASSKDTVSHITHIIVDEIHERDRFTDFMLAMIRDILPSNPHLHLVLMSATFDAERFSVYFGGCPIIRVPGFTYPVKSFYLNDVLSELRSTENTLFTSTQDNDTKEDSTLTEEFKIALDESIDLAMLSGEFDVLLSLLEVIYSKGDKKVLNHQTAKTRLTPLMVFATKGRVSDICLLLSCGVDCTLQSSNGKTALQFAEQSNQEEAAEIIKKHMEKTFTSSEEDQRLLENYLSSSKSRSIDYVLIEQLLKKICTDSSEGAILIFLPGWDDIKKTQEKLDKNPLFNDSSKFVIIPLHSMIPADEQKKVFQRPPQGCRKIILSTNIAETSVTVDDVVYVIDSGRMKEKNYDPYSNEITLQSNWISKASMKQREGRAGRCQPGICYHLYSKSCADSLPDFQVPEIKRMPIEELCLQVKLIDPSCKIEEFLKKTLDPPIFETLCNAITVLQDMGALSLDEELTDLGRKLGSLPLHPLKSRMLFLGILLDCLDTALTLVCASEYRDPFILPMIPDEKKKASDAKSELASFYGGTGDQLALLAAYEGWEKSKNKFEFCHKYFIAYNTMRMISGMRRQLKEELCRNGFLGRSKSCSKNNCDLGIIQAVLVSGVYPKVGKFVSDGRLNCVELVDGKKVRLGHASSNCKLPKKKNRPQTLIAYDEVTRTDAGLSIRKSNIIGSLPFLLLAKEIVVAPLKRNGNEDDASEEDRGKKLMSSADNIVQVFVDRWVTFESTALDAAQIYYLRERLSAAIMLKIIHPKKSLPEHLGASLSAITQLLSYDGMSGIPLELGLGRSLTTVVGSSDISRANQVDITTGNVMLHSKETGRDKVEQREMLGIPLELGSGKSPTTVVGSSDISQANQVDVTTENVTHYSGVMTKKYRKRKAAAAMEGREKDKKLKRMAATEGKERDKVKEGEIDSEMMTGKRTEEELDRPNQLTDQKDKTEEELDSPNQLTGQNDKTKLGKWLNKKN